jgi:hypothetical protein
MDHDDPENITSLFLDNRKIPALKRLLEPSATQNVLSDYANLTFLSMTNVGLVSLQGFPRLDNLKRVYDVYAMLMSVIINGQ